MSSLRNTPHADAPLLARLLAVLYGIWTLLPNSNSWMVGWPWVVIWQGAVLLPSLWCLWQGWYQPRSRLALGFGWDRWMGVAVLALGISTWGALFPAQSRWQAMAALGGLAAVYGIHGWLQTPVAPAARRRRWMGLVQGQGGLAIAFILLSLSLWTVQTYLPEQQHLQDLAAAGVERRFSLNLLDVRNWYPLGHQNYVAGFLVLNLPLLAGLAWATPGRWRGLWLAGLGLGLVDLYTTGSRAGGLGLLGAFAAGALFLAASRPWPWRYWLLGGGAALGMGLVGLVTNARLLRSLQAVLRGDFASGELAYRWITIATGWRMGLAHVWTGTGLGAVPLAYQGYRPVWAGREAELIHQLHNTPIQLWAELGLWGVGLLLVAISLILGLAIRWLRWSRTSPEGALHPLESGAASPIQEKDQPPTEGTQTAQIPVVHSPPLVGSLLAGLAGYGAVSLTDYQLDNIAISGSLALFLALLLRAMPQQWGEAREAGKTGDSPVGLETAEPQELAPPGRGQRRVVLGLAGLLLVLTLGLIPSHRAWSLSSSGFAALEAGQINTFVTRLTQAHRLAPHEPYYPYQLGWNLGERSLQADIDEAERERLRTDAIAWFEIAIAQAPQLEFGHSNLGWLLGNSDPTAAATAFMRALELVPAKPGVAFGLALQLFAAQQPTLAENALVLEALRHPQFLTSPLWRQEDFAAVYPRIMAQVLAQQDQWLGDPALDPALAAHLHSVRGALHWWQGDGAAAQADWAAIDNSVGVALAKLTTEGTVDPLLLAPSGNPIVLTVQAWLQPEQRRSRLAQAWAANPALDSSWADALAPPGLLNALEATMAEASDFLDWVKNTAPTVQQRHERLGFGVLMRHIDGPQPVDYWFQVNNVVTTTLLQPLFPSPAFLPALDEALQPLHQTAIAAIQVALPPS
ncbi:O-antigen ligase family protein [Leptolyngbya sp. PCC 6406]|uniref:O-antigen ligase family protein n=1 Tax=Leptolyngbya sp. PCC 6406 TaxID=1173264 RepID=UPI0002EDC8EB|nr:O-antigen ligase family protein [Leptolyngbya sp. PCC 6406]